MSDLKSSVPNDNNVPAVEGDKKSRMPVQERSLQRIAKTITTAERMLVELGPEKTSIPEIAKISGVPRASIYQYFPDKYVLFSHLAELQMKHVAEAISTTVVVYRDSAWQTFTKMLILAAADYYNANPIASLLLLNEPFSRSDHLAHLAKNQAIGNLIRSHEALSSLPTAPDVATLAVEVAFACMKYSYGINGNISVAICNEATVAVNAYLSQYITSEQHT